MIQYFAYGSNMNSKDLQEWCNKKDLKIILKNPRVAKLIDYKLDFTHYSATRGGGVADIVKFNGGQVYGILFELDEESLKKLDKKEGVSNRVYQRVKVIVSTGKEVFDNIITYEVVEKESYKPNEKYLNIIIEGAKEYGLPEWYTADLESINTSN